MMTDHEIIFSFYLLLISFISFIYTHTHLFKEYFTISQILVVGEGQV